MCLRRQTNKQDSYCFLSHCFLSLSGVAFFSSRNCGSRVFVKCVHVSEIQKLQRKPQCPSNVVSSVTNKITFPCHISDWGQLTSSTRYCFVSSGVAFMSLRTVALDLSVCSSISEWSFASYTVSMFTSTMDMHRNIEIFSDTINVVMSNFAGWYYSESCTCLYHFQWCWLYFKVTVVSWL